MKSLILFLSILFCVYGCAATYKQDDLITISSKLDRTQGVLISTPQDGWYGERQYRNSGKMTVNAVRSAFLKNTQIADVTESCHGENCLKDINVEKYGYYVKPEIIHWEDRATEWSGIPDKLEIQIVVFDTVTKRELANSSYKGKSKWMTFGGDHPQDLLPEPTNKYVNSLYE